MAEGDTGKGGEGASAASTDGKPADKTGATGAGSGAGTSGTSLLGGAKDSSSGTDLKDGQAKTEEGKAGEAKDGKDGKDGQKQGAPAQYADFTMPEGITVDKGQMDAFKALAKDANLSQESAQKFADMYGQIVKGQAKASEDAWKAAVEEAKAETLKALGPTPDKELAFAAKAIDRLGTPGLREFLDKSGAGNQKDLAMFLINVGKAISEDPLASGRSGNAGPKSHAEVLYGANQS